MQLFKNVASQKIRVFAFADAGHATLDAGEPVTGDAAQISAQTALDNAALGASNDVAPTEVDATNAPGYYEFDATQAETNGDVIEWYPKSSTAGVQVVTVGGNVQTLLPPNHPSMGIESDGDITKVNLVATTTTNTDMRGTDSAALASVCTEARLAELDAANLPADVDTLKANVTTILGRITSTLFTGITSLAEWLGLLAGKQAADATALAEVKATGAGSGTYSETTDSLEAVRDRGDAAWITATGFSTLVASDIVSDGTALNTTAGVLDRVTLTDTTTTNTDMRGTDSAALASVCTEGRLAELDAANLPADVDAVLADTGTDGVKLNATQPTGWAANLVASAGQIIIGTVDTVTNTHTPTTTEFQADDITEATDNHYNGRVIIFTSGALAGQATSISDYAAVGGIGQFTVVALTEPPANDVTFIIV